MFTLEGESVNGYARRVLRGWQKFSDHWRNIDLGTVRGPTLGVADDIMKAAADEAKHPKAPSGFLMERKTGDGAGHFVTQFYGSPSIWMNRHAGLKRLVSKINLKPSQSYTAP